MLPVGGAASGHVSGAAPSSMTSAHVPFPALIAVEAARIAEGALEARREGTRPHQASEGTRGRRVKRLSPRPAYRGATSRAAWAPPPPPLVQAGKAARATAVARGHGRASVGETFTCSPWSMLRRHDPSRVPLREHEPRLRLAPRRRDRERAVRGARDRRPRARSPERVGRQTRARPRAAAPRREGPRPRPRRGNREGGARGDRQARGRGAPFGGPADRGRRRVLGRLGRGAPRRDRGGARPDELPRQARLHLQGAARRGRAHHAVELPRGAAAADAAAGAPRGQRRRVQAERGDPARRQARVRSVRGAAPRGRARARAGRRGRRGR